MERDVGRHAVTCAWETDFVAALRDIDRQTDSGEPLVVRTSPAPSLPGRAAHRDGVSLCPVAPSFTG